MKNMGRAMTCLLALLMSGPACFIGVLEIDQREKEAAQEDKDDEKAAPEKTREKTQDNADAGGTSEAAERGESGAGRDASASADSGGYEVPCSVAVSGICAESMQTPEWAEEAEGAFSIEGGAQSVEVLAYRMNQGERLTDFMRRSEIGDAFLSASQLRTGNGKMAYLYETNDHGAEGSVHITVSSPPLVYYFFTENSQNMNELRRLVESAEVQ